MGDYFLLGDTAYFSREFNFIILYHHLVMLRVLLGRKKDVTLKLVGTGLLSKTPLVHSSVNLEGCAIFKTVNLIS